MRDLPLPSADYATVIRKECESPRRSPRGPSQADARTAIQELSSRVLDDILSHIEPFKPRSGSSETTLYSGDMQTILHYQPGNRMHLKYILIHCIVNELRNHFCHETPTKTDLLTTKINLKAIASFAACDLQILAKYHNIEAFSLADALDFQRHTWHTTATASNLRFLGDASNEKVAIVLFLKREVRRLSQYKDAQTKINEMNTWIEGLENYPSTHSFSELCRWAPNGKQNLLQVLQMHRVPGKTKPTKAFQRFCREFGLDKKMGSTILAEIPKQSPRPR